MNAITKQMTAACVAMSLCSVAGAAAAVDGGEKAGASAGTVKSRTFNVLNYGAVGDDKTDNTEAFSACLKAVIAAGGGKMFIPDGIYRGRIVIPGTKEWITVEIAGESEPTPVWGTIGTFVFPKNGTIIKCLSESGPAVISSASVPEKLYERCPQLLGCRGQCRCGRDVHPQRRRGHLGPADRLRSKGRQGDDQVIEY